jgi:2,4-dienoyl-CoA reductase (NADPH2)
VREAAPVGKEFTVACRLSAHDLHPDGNTREDIMYTFERVGDCGLVDLITTSVGLPDSPVPTLHSYVPKGIFARCVKEIRTHLRKQKIDIPIAASHRITSPTVAEQLLTNDACDMVGVGRALLADSQFVKNAKENNHLASIPCIGCNWCADQFWKNKRVGCALNPRSGYELDRPLHPATHPRAIAVVGAGATGIVCALTLARRGHSVILYERNDEIGGQLNLAKLIPGKEDYWAILDHWTRELKESNVTLKLNSKFCRADVAGGHQMLHAVVFCCGSQPRPISSHNFITAENRTIVGFWDVLTRKVIPGHKCAIIGQGAIGYDMASYLLHDPRISRDEVMWLQENGVSTEDFSFSPEKQANPKRNSREVTIIQNPNHPPGLNVTTGWSLKNRIKNHQGVSIDSGLIAKVDELGLHMQVHKPNKTDFSNLILKVDTIIWCFGMLPNMVEGTWIHEWIKDGAIDRGQAAGDFRMYIAGSGRNNKGMQGQGEQDLLLCINEGFEIGSKI